MNKAILIAVVAGAAGCMDVSDPGTAESMSTGAEPWACSDGETCLKRAEPADPVPDPCADSCGDGTTDGNCGEWCDDGLWGSGACTASCEVAAGSCNPYRTIRCGETVKGHTGEPGSTHNQSQYACANWDASGREIAFAFVPPEQTMRVELALQGSDGFSPRVYVVDRGEDYGCDGSMCLRGARVSALFDSNLRDNLAFVVDGNVEDGEFTLKVTCTPQ